MSTPATTGDPGMLHKASKDPKLLSEHGRGYPKEVEFSWVDHSPTLPTYKYTFSPVCEVTRRVDRRSKRAACKGAKVRLNSAQHRFQRKSLCALLSVGPRATIHPLIQVTLRGSPQSEESLGSFGLSCIL